MRCFETASLWQTHIFDASYWKSTCSDLIAFSKVNLRRKLFVVVVVDAITPPLPRDGDKA